MPQLKLKGRIVKHDTSAQTGDGVDLLKVTVQLENLIGSEPVKTTLTFATRARDAVGGALAADQYPLDEQLEITIAPAKS